MESPEPTITPEKRMTVALGYHAMMLEKALKAYYEQHQANGCKCQLCIDAELAFASMARAH